MIPLRPYQQRDIERIRAAFGSGRNRIIYVAPTGSGKTVCFSYVAANAVAKGKRVAVLAHRQEIADQISAALSTMGVAHGRIQPGHPMTDEMVQVGMVQTAARRLDRLIAPDLLVIDEAHHSIARTWQKVLEAWPKAKVLGVTATPERLDGRGLGDIFDEMVIGPDVAELTRLGFLAPALVYAPALRPDLSGLRTVAGDYDRGALAKLMSAGAIVGDAVEHYGRLAPGKAAIAFCCSIKHSRLVAERFREAGWRAAHVDGDTAPDERRRLIASLGDGGIDVLSNCSLFGEGVDVPALGAVILLRPTQSLALHLQMVGRALRPAEGKDHAIILDHAGNSFRHGLPSDEREWSLASKKRRKGGVPDLIRCDDGQLSPAGVPDATEVAGTLAEADEISVMRMRVRGMRYADALAWADNPDKVRFAAKARGYKSGWAWHRIQEMRAGAVADVAPKLMGDAA